MDFNSLDELFADFQSTVIAEVIPEIENEVETIIQEESEHIYEEFTPTQYERTFDFEKRENIQSTTVNIGDEIIITTMNNTLANGDEKGEFLDDIIENGERYGWSHNPPKRPFMERSNERIQNEHIVEEVVKTTLSKKYNLE